MNLESVAQHVESKEPLLLFVDRHGDLDGVTIRKTEAEECELGIQGVHLALTEPAVPAVPISRFVPSWMESFRTATAT